MQNDQGIDNGTPMKVPGTPVPDTDKKPDGEEQKDCNTISHKVTKAMGY